MRHDSTLDVRVPKGVEIATAQDGTDVVDIHYFAGDPNSTISADIGSFCFDTTGGAPWYKTTDTVNTGWVQVTNVVDTNITTGSLSAATGNRTVDFGSNGLTFDNLTQFTANGGGDWYIDSSYVRIQPANTGVAGSISLADNDNSKDITIVSPAIITGVSYDIVLPPAAPSANDQVMSFTTGGVGSFTDQIHFLNTDLMASSARIHELSQNGFRINGDGANAAVFDIDNQTLFLRGGIPTDNGQINIDSSGIDLGFAGDGHLAIEGSSGSSGQFLKSQGFGNPPVWDALPVDPDTNITTGTLAAATGTRSIDFGGNDLNFNNTGAFNVTTTAQMVVDGSYLGVQGTGAAVGVLRLYDGDNSAYVGIVPHPVTTFYDITLPAAAPSSNGQIMTFQTNGLASFDDPVDTNITTGTLAAATGNRTVDLGNNQLNFSNVSTANWTFSGGTNHTGDFALFGVGANNSYFQFYDSDNSQYCAITTATSMTNWTWTLPAAGPASNDQMMSFTSTGVASFIDIPTDTSITEGTLGTAGGARSVPMGGNTLAFNDVLSVSFDNGALSPTVLQLLEDSDNGTNFVGLTAPAAIGATITYTLPLAPSSNGQLLVGNTDGTMSWITQTAPMHLEGTLDVGGGATFSSPAGEDEGSWYIITNASATGTTFGTGGPTVFTGDSVVVKNGVVSTTLDDGTQWLQIDSGTDVTSVQTGSGGTATTGAVVIADASETVVGVVELATSAEATAGGNTTLAVHPTGLNAKVDSYTATYPSGATGEGVAVPITHNLAGEVTYMIRETSGGTQVQPSVVVTNNNTLTVTHALATSLNEFTITVQRVA